MKRIFSLLFLIVLIFNSSCSSDSDSYTSEEKELRTLLNNEWQAIEWEEMGFYERKNSEEGSLTKEKIDDLLDKTWLKPFRKPYVVTLGMNKKGGIYYLLRHENKNNTIENPVIDFLYVDTKQKDNAFTGCFYNLTTPDKVVGKRSFYIRKIDENTIKVLFFLAELNTGETTNYYYSVLLMKKKGPWDESMSVKKLLERYNFEPNFIEMMGGENFEKEVAVKNCQ